MKTYLKQRPDRARWVYWVYFGSLLLTHGLPGGVRFLVLASVITWLSVTKKGRPER